MDSKKPRIFDINWLYAKYYGDNLQLRRIVTIHSEMVAKKALEIAKQKNLPLDPIDIYCAAMLHDIGVVKCKAPDIFAFGDHHYILHGLEGKKILERHGLYKYAGVCLSHTGAGLTKKDIIKNNFPLPHVNMLPESLLEKLICYADKFYSKSGNLTHEKNIDEIKQQMKKYGEDSLARFLELDSLFSSV